MSPPPIVNAPAPNTPYFTPAQSPAGSAVIPQPNGKRIPKLSNHSRFVVSSFTTGYSLRTISANINKTSNEFGRHQLSPLCQYSADEGSMTPWHLAHRLSIVEATAILPEGRITPEDSGIWSDAQIGPLAKIVEFAHSQNQKMGIQLAHAGRKASTLAPWLGVDGTAEECVGGWPENVWAPSAVPWSETYPKPNELTKEGIKKIVGAFVDAAKRALKAGFDVIEIHNAHGYLLNSFLSPVSNKRTDEYGGSFKNRIRLTLEVVDGVRAVIPRDMPLFLRISATDWLELALPNEPSWRCEDTVKFSHILAPHGVDFLDVSTGGNHPLQNIKGGPAYQAPFAEAVKKSVGSKLFVGCVGAITDGFTAQGVLDKEQADAVLVGRQFQRNPATVWAMADDLDVDINIAHQIVWGFKGRGKKAAREAKESKAKI